MIIDNNLLAYEFERNQFTPNKIYPSGEKDEDKLNNQYNFSKHSPAVLIIEDDIVNKDGNGLKKGFYNVLPDKNLDFLYIYQAGKIKAKVPILKYEVLESFETKQEKPRKMSYKKYLKEQEKEKQKYIKGQNPNTLDYKEAQIHYIDEQKAYLIIYNTNNLEITAVMKF